MPRQASPSPHPSWLRVQDPPGPVTPEMLRFCTVELIALRQRVDLLIRLDLLLLEGQSEQVRPAAAATAAAGNGRRGRRRRANGRDGGGRPP